MIEFQMKLEVLGEAEWQVDAYKGATSVETLLLDDIDGEGWGELEDQIWTPSNRITTRDTRIKDSRIWDMLDQKEQEAA
jgi:hypothetical protein